MNKYLLSAAMLLFVTSAQAARVKDVATVEGVRHNQLVGYGLVVVCRVPASKARSLSKASKPCWLILVLICRPA